MLANGIMKAEEFLGALDASAEARVTAQEGDTVLGSDHGEIGTVKEIVPASPDIEGYLLVPQGILKSDIYVPLEAVVRRSGSTVFINVPKLVIATMPWSEPPTREAKQEKEGSPAESVDKLYRSRAPTAFSGSTQSQD
jgi:hypothetical protein